MHFLKNQTPTQPIHMLEAMEGTRKIMRRSIYSFLQNYQDFTSIAALLAFPFSVSVLLSQVFVPSALSIHNSLRTLFQAAGFPSYSEFFNILTLKLSQTISSSIFTVPLTLTFFVISKAYVIKTLNQNKQTLLLYRPILLTYICNLFILLSVNATTLSILFLGFNLVKEFGFSSPNWFPMVSAAGAVVYSIILANAIVVCNLALVLSGIEGCGGWISILKAFILIRGRSTIALSLALSVNLFLAGIEDLFQYRIVRAYRSYGHPNFAMALEGILIAYLYSIFVVLDTVINCMFYKRCKRMGQEAMYSFQFDFAEEEESYGHMSLKAMEEIP